MLTDWIFGTRTEVKWGRELREKSDERILLILCLTLYPPNDQKKKKAEEFGLNIWECREIFFC